MKACEKERRHALPNPYLSDNPEKKHGGRRGELMNNILWMNVKMEFCVFSFFGGNGKMKESYFIKSDYTNELADFYYFDKNDLRLSF